MIDAEVAHAPLSRLPPLPCTRRLTLLALPTLALTLPATSTVPPKLKSREPAVMFRSPAIWLPPATNSVPGPVRLKSTVPIDVLAEVSNNAPPLAVMAPLCVIAPLA